MPSKNEELFNWAEPFLILPTPCGTAAARTGSSRGRSCTSWRRHPTRASFL